MRRNRWAAEVTVDISPLDGGSVALLSVDMLGNKHFALIDEIAAAVGDDIFDDRGVSEAVERLGKPFGSSGVKRCATCAICCTPPNG